MDDLRPKLEQALAGSYVIERELGGGGMSRTYLATENALQRKVVIKVLAPELLAGISVERFRREILLAAQLQHPHVVPVLVAGDVDGIPWFTMPYVDGNSLRDRLDRGAVPADEAISILRDVARALSYAHGHGIVHRDIKPDNVLLSSGSATVTDFGIAKAINAARTGVGADGGEALTQVGTSIGTPAYMAPEQALGDPDTDHRADIYAFGVMAYELLAGELPFRGANPSKLLAAHINTPPPDLSTTRPDTPPALAGLVAQCLSKEPDERPQDAKSMARVLENVTTSGSPSSIPDILRGGQMPLGKALAIWAVAAGLVVLTAWAAREAIGLPDWVLPGAIGVMLAGLPVLAFTAFAQRTTHRAFTMTPEHGGKHQHGTMATLALKASPHLSWRKAWTGGGVAVGGFAVLVIGFMVMRAMGIGPMGSLQGKGVFGAEETIVVADFISPPDDATLGSTIAEALRTDLAQSTTLKVLTRSDIREVLGLMQRPEQGAVPYELAREIATREGAKAVLDGQVVQLGQTYVVSARLVSSLDGRDLVTFRETAANEDALIDALSRISHSVRERAGESLRHIQASNELERVTTPSLAALRKYVEGVRLADEEGEGDRGLALLTEAVELDTAFAMAWRKIAVLLSNQGRDRDRELTAISTAFRHRERLSEMERYLMEAYYYSRGPEPDQNKALASYQAASELDSLSMTALNNAGNIYVERREFARAESLFRKVVALPRTFGGGFLNLLDAQIRIGRTESLDSTAAAFRVVFPESNHLWEADVWAAWGKWDLAATDSLLRPILEDPKTTRQGIFAPGYAAAFSELQGKLRDGLRLYQQASDMRQRSAPGGAALLEFTLDTMWFEAVHGNGHDAVLAAWRRGVERADLDQIAPSERPWDAVATIAALIRDPDLARQAAEGYEADHAGLTPDPIGKRASFAARTALAEGRWDDVITAIHEADRRFAVEQRTADLLRGFAYQEKGAADSAIATFDRYVGSRDTDLRLDAMFLPEVLQRLGALKESIGDRAGAIAVYGEFVELWKDADPEFQPLVQEVRARISLLQREIG